MTTPPEVPLSPRELRAQRRQERIQRRAKRAARRAAKQVEASVSPPAPEVAHKPPPNGPSFALEGTPFVDAQRRPLHIDGLYRNATAFLVLSGPSLNDLDLSLLEKRGIITLGVNNSPVTFRTQFWCYVDRARKFHNGIWQDPGVLKIVPGGPKKHHLHKPLQHKTPNGKFVELNKQAAFGPNTPDGRKAATPADMPGVVGYIRNATFNPDRWLPEPSINWGNSKRSARRNGHPRNLNVMFCAVKVAYALGFRRLYLLGCDFHMHTSRPYAFAQGKGAGGVASNNHTYGILNDMFEMLRPRFERAGFELFNCNPNSGFEVFPHVSYADAIDDAVAQMPAEPLDSRGWYGV